MLILIYFQPRYLMVQIHLVLPLIYASRVSSRKNFKIKARNHLNVCIYFLVYFWMFSMSQGMWGKQHQYFTIGEFMFHMYEEYFIWICGLVTKGAYMCALCIWCACKSTLHLMIWWDDWFDWFDEKINYEMLSNLERWPCNKYKSIFNLYEW